MNYFFYDYLWLWLIVSLLLIVILIYTLKRRSVFSKADQKFFLEKWDNVLREPDHRHQVMEADKLLDKVLSKRGYRGSLGEKLKKAKAHFSNYNGVWSAHRLRNKLAHELNFRISKKEANQALERFRTALKDLGLFP